MGKICMNCGQIINKELEQCQYCNSNKVVELNSSATLGDYFVLRKISHDGNFIKEMMELHDEDIIKYTEKISQFKANLGQQESVKIQTDTRPKCPTCGSTNLRKVSATSKVASVALWGLFSQKVKKTWHCNECGYEW